MVWRVKKGMPSPVGLQEPLNSQPDGKRDDTPKYVGVEAFLVAGCGPHPKVPGFRRLAESCLKARTEKPTPEGVQNVLL